MPVKISIYRKFLLGIITAMISVFVVSLTVFLQLRPPDSPEFHVYPLIQYMERVFSAELSAADTYLQSEDKTDRRKLEFLFNHFDKNADSLG